YGVVARDKTGESAAGLVCSSVKTVSVSWSTVAACYRYAAGGKSVAQHVGLCGDGAVHRSGRFCDSHGNILGATVGILHRYGVVARDKTGESAAGLVCSSVKTVSVSWSTVAACYR